MRRGTWRRPALSSGLAAVICDVVFDVPLRQAFTYAVPAGLPLARGQRVSAPLHGRARVGVAVDVRDGDRAGLLPIERAVEGAPIVSAAMLELSHWAAEQSLASWGSTLLSLLPPVPRGSAEAVAPPPEVRPGEPAPAELWIGASREARLADQLRAAATSALVIVPTREDAAAWAGRLDAARLDSGVGDAARRAAWFAAARGRSRVIVGNRAALLAPLPPPATLALIDEHDPAHRPPGHPRIHARDLLRRRAELEGSRLLLLSAAPSAESWWEAERRGAIRGDGADEARAEVIASDTRRILRNHPLTLPLTRAIEEATRRGRRAVLVVPRRAAGLVCGECGLLPRCPDCAVPLAFARGGQRLVCRLCARALPSPERCPGCGGHKLSQLGWDPERVERAVAKRFPRARVSRTDRGADVVVGTPAVLRGVEPGSAACVGIVAIDSLLGLPDFRGGERAFQLIWAAREALAPGGRVIVQTLHPEHYAVQAARDGDRRGFYKQELELRAELGYPPFRRLCRVSVRSRSDAEARARIAECARALDGIPGVDVYPAAPAGSASGPSHRWQLLVKGPAELSRLIGPALSGGPASRRRGATVVEVEMDPV